MSATAAELLAWFEDAQYALETLDGALSVTWLKALLAQPARLMPGQRRTWYLEEAERVQRQMMRDVMPMQGEITDWRERQDRRESLVLTYLDQHAEACAEAAYYARLGTRSARPASTRPVAPRSAAKKTKTRLSAADMALGTLDRKDAA
jgi:hypothetical protein